MRVALGIEYNGSAYCGWQFQDHSPSVQEEVEKALSFVADHQVRVICAGRTDTGVHAHTQVIHFDTTSQRDEKAWVFGANTRLPHDISVLWARPVDDSFHARFSATSRLYRYVILNRTVRPGLLQNRVSWQFRPLDESRMQQAAQYLIGEHDFSSYRALACQAHSPVRTLHTLEVKRNGEFITLDLEANGFLHHMVRNIAGVLMTIGHGEQEPIWAKEVLDYRDRRLGGLTAPPFGLYFVGVRYPTEYQLPSLLPARSLW